MILTFKYKVGNSCLLLPAIKQTDKNNKILARKKNKNISSNKTREFLSSAVGRI